LPFGWRTGIVIHVRVSGAMAMGLAALAVACGSGRSERSISCPTPGAPPPYTAKFTPGIARSPVDSLYVTFTQRRPTGDEAVAVLQNCVMATVRDVQIEYDLIATAWFNMEGPLPLPDGSSNLTYDLKTKAIKTFNQRASTAAAASAAARPEYAVSQQKHATPAPPFASLVTLDVVFAKPADPRAAMKILVEELRRAVAEQTPPVNTVAYARVAQPGSQPIHSELGGLKGAFLSAHFDARSGQIFDQDRRPLGSIK
jgi:hypothetical protein